MRRWIKQNYNPLGLLVDDCVIRAIATATGKTWDDVFLELSMVAYSEKVLINSNKVWGKYLVDNGFVKRNLPDTCPNCYTVNDFAEDHKFGIYVVGDGAHAIAVIDGYYIDTWDSGDRTVLFFYERQVIRDE